MINNIPRVPATFSSGASASTESAREKPSARESKRGKKFETNKEVIVKKPWSYILYRIDGKYVLSVVCGTVALFDRNIPLNPEEVAQALESSESLDALAAEIFNGGDEYRLRHINIR